MIGHWKYLDNFRAGGQINTCGEDAIMTSGLGRPADLK
jgi:hypothetical protein